MVAALTKITSRQFFAVDRLLTGRMPLGDINTGFGRLQVGRAVRQVVVF